MALTHTKTPLVLFVLKLFLFSMLAFWLKPLPVLATGSAAAIPTFNDFSTTVQNGQKDVLRGVYVENVLALPVVQQPSSNAAFVSNNDGEITQFGLASQFGNTGLLAHNTLSGRFFSQLAVGQEVRLIYGDGRVEIFVIEKLLKFQALQPTSPLSSFKSLDLDETLTAEQMFKRAYLGDRHVTFQTCIAAAGNASWGRLFVIAMPKRDVQKTHQDRHYAN